MTAATLNINSSAVAFGDTVLTNNPRRKYFDWQRSNNGIACDNPESRQFSLLPETKTTLFDGLRATTVAGDTIFSLTNILGDTYRMEFESGTDPTFATNRVIALAGDTTFTIVVNNNSTITMTADVGTPFANVVVGDTVYVYGVADGLTSTFHPDNEGAWLVLARSNTAVTLYRPTGVEFAGAGEVVTLSAVADKIVAYRASGVQVGDKVRIVSGFQSLARRTYEVTNVTSKFVDFVSTTPLADEVDIAPTATGIYFYSSAKRFVRLECDQECKVFLNGSTDERMSVSPWAAGDGDQMGWLELTGPIWKIEVTNVASDNAVVNVFSAE